jgi:hypothetical protein
VEGEPVFGRKREPQVKPAVLGTLARVSGFLACEAEAVGVPVIVVTTTAGWMTSVSGSLVGVVTVRVQVGPSDRPRLDSVACAARLAAALGLREQTRQVTHGMVQEVHAGWLSEGSSLCPMRLEIVSTPTH